MLELHKETSRIRNADELRADAHAFALSLVPHTNSATVVALYGDLGSGKTTFVQEAARAQGVTKTVISPTFVIERVYKLTNRKFERLVHIDCYRIESAKEIAAIGWKENLAHPGNLIFVEWAERIEELLPEDTLRISFEVVDETKRQIRISNSSHKT